MPTIRMQCPECDAAIRVSDSLKTGAKVRCPACDTVFKKPKEDPVEAVVVTSTKATRRRRVVDEDHDPEDEGSGNSKLWAWIIGGAAGLVLIGAVVAIIIGVAGSGGSSSSVAQVSSDRSSSSPRQSSSVVNQRSSMPDSKSSGLASSSSVPIKTVAKSIIEDVPFDGPLPELPRMPALNERPYLVLDARGHTGLVRRVFFTPDDSKILSISNDKTIRVWDLEADESIKVMRTPIGPGVEGSHSAAALSADGKFLAVGGFPVGAGALGMPFQVISLDTEQVVQVFKYHQQPVSALAFAPNGEWIASGSLDGEVLLNNREDGKYLPLKRMHKSKIGQIAFPPDGAIFATASEDNTACIWNPAAQDKNKVLQGHTAPCIAVAWSHDGKMLATGGIDATIRIYSRDGELIKVIPKDAISGGRDTQVISLAFLPNNKEVLYTGIADKGEAGIVDIASAKRRLRFTQHSNTAIHGSLSRDGQLAVTTGGDRNEIYVWRTDTGKVLHQYFGAGQAIWGVAWSEDGNSIGWGNVNRGSVFLGAPPAVQRFFHLDSFDFGPPPQKVIRDLLALDHYTLERTDFFHVAVKKDGQLLFVHDTSADRNRIDSLCLLPGDRAVVGGDYGPYLLDLKTNKVIREFKGIVGQTFGIAPSPNFRYFVTGGTDQILHVWSPERDEALFSIFVAGWDWIAWTPEGYYSCSGNGERLMGWQTNHGIDKLASFAPAAQFRGSMYQPELLGRLPSAGLLPKAIALVNRDDKKTIPPLVLNDVLPPSVGIVTPRFVAGEDFKLANGDTIEVKAQAASQGKYPVKAMRLLVDGRPYQGKKGIQAVTTPQVGAVGAGWSVKLSPGTHVLTVQADSGVSKGMSSPLRVTVPGAVNDARPNLYMLAFGISAYPGKLRLNFAASDATMMTNAFKQYAAGSFGKIESRLILDKDATRARILQELDWLASVMTPNDVAIVFFSGHGARDDIGNFVLVPVDVSRRNIVGSSVSGDEVRERMENMSGRLILMMDCCHSGTVAEDMLLSRGDNLMRDLSSDDCGVIVLSSSLGSEYSLESEETRAGFFSLGIVEGLSGKADVNEDKKIYLHELLYYATLRVQQLSEGQQNPIGSKPPGIRSFPLATMR